MFRKGRIAVKRILACLFAVCLLLLPLPRAHAEVLPHEHTLELAEVLEKPFCTGSGLALYRCADPDCTYSERKGIHSLGHHMVLDQVKAEVSCTETGVLLYRCDREDCRFILFVNFFRLGHDLERMETLKEPSCTETGEAVFACRREGCDYTKQAAVPALGHTWDQGTVTAEPGEKSPGRLEYRCTACGAVRAEEIPPLGAVYQVEFPSGKHFHFDLEGVQSVRADGELRFTLELEEGWKRGRMFAVKADNARITEIEEGVFVIDSVTAGTKVTVTGVVWDVPSGE